MNEPTDPLGYLLHRLADKLAAFLHALGVESVPEALLLVWHTLWPVAPVGVGVSVALAAVQMLAGEKH